MGGGPSATLLAWLDALWANDRLPALTCWPT